MKIQSLWKKSLKKTKKSPKRPKKPEVQYKPPVRIQNSPEFLTICNAMTGLNTTFPISFSEFILTMTHSLVL